MSGPDFRELVGDDLPSEERARLQRVHDQLVAAGAPPELPPALQNPPAAGGSVAWLPRRRLGAALVLAASLALAVFAAGFLFGNGRDSDPSAFKPVRTAVLGNQGATAVVRVGKPDDAGNRPMLVTVEGLRRLPEGDYYTLFMTRKGKVVATCGTFNVSGTERKDVRFTVAYDFDKYDGLLLAEYRVSDHKDHPVLRTTI
jgi:hypothetical protein